jgi:CheY-like chemotaxis protein
MSLRPVKLLHVEDNRAQHVMVAALLRGLQEFDFAITRASTEEAAVAEFGGGGYEFVLLDYQLDEGDGLSCLRRLREIDPLVPIVAVSGMATEEVAADLLRSGADDYVNKMELTFDGFARSVREALARTDAFRRRRGVPRLVPGVHGRPGAGVPGPARRLRGGGARGGLTEEGLRLAFEEVCAAWPHRGAARLAAAAAGVVPAPLRHRPPARRRVIRPSRARSAAE